MAQIGSFTRNNDGFFGNVSTLTLDAKLAILPAEKSDAENAPDHCVFCEGMEIGAAWNVPARRLATTSQSPSMIRRSRSRSAPICFSPMPRKVSGLCTGAARRSATSEVDRMRRLRSTQPFASNPLIDQALVKPFDPIASQAAAARSEGQGRPDACRSPQTLIAPQFVAKSSGRRSLAIDGSEHGGSVMALRDGGVCAGVHRGTAILSACVVLILSVSAICAEPLSRNERPALSSSKTWSADPWSAHIREAAKRFALSERLLRAVMHFESVGDVHAVSSKGAMGLMQIMPATWEELRIKHHLGDDSYQPRDNIFAGAAYLREMLDRFGRNGFLAAYNAGPGRYEEHLATGRPLPRETVDYVRKLAPLINGAVPIPTRARQGAGRASALGSAIFAHAVNTPNGSASQVDRETDGPVETVFAAIGSPSLRAPVGKAVTDLTALVPQVDGSHSGGALDPNPTVLGPPVQSSSRAAQ